MEQICGKSIDWVRTGKNLEYLRRHNVKLIKKVCAYCRSREDSKTYCERSEEHTSELQSQR